jgi:hypothetical protein
LSFTVGQNATHRNESTSLKNLKSPYHRVVQAKITFSNTIKLQLTLLTQSFKYIRKEKKNLGRLLRPVILED